MQSVLAGMALSGFGMVLATFGLLPPVAGAIFQEAIDVAVILNALRALTGGDLPKSSVAPEGKWPASDLGARVPATAGR